MTFPSRQARARAGVTVRRTGSAAGGPGEEARRAVRPSPPSWSTPSGVWPEAPEVLGGVDVGERLGPGDRFPLLRLDPADGPRRRPSSPAAPAATRPPAASARPPRPGRRARSGRTCSCGWPPARGTAVAVPARSGQQPEQHRPPPGACRPPGRAPARRARRPAAPRRRRSDCRQRPAPRRVLPHRRQGRPAGPDLHHRIGHGGQYGRPPGRPGADRPPRSAPCRCPCGGSPRRSAAGRRWRAGVGACRQF